MKLIIGLLFSIATLGAAAQNNYIKKPTLTVNVSSFDYKTAKLVNGSSVNTVLINHKWTKFSGQDIGFGLTYLQGITNNIDFAGSLNGGFVNYKAKGSTSNSTNQKFLLEGDAMVNIKLFSDKHCVVPYLSTGIGIGSYGKSYNAYLPTGAGLQFKIVEATYLMVNFQYRYAITDRAANHYFYNVGIAAKL